MGISDLNFVLNVRIEDHVEQGELQGAARCLTSGQEEVHVDVPQVLLGVFSILLKSSLLTSFFVRVYQILVPFFYNR